MLGAYLTIIFFLFSIFGEFYWGGAQWGLDLLWSRFQVAIRGTVALGMLRYAGSSSSLEVAICLAKDAIQAMPVVRNGTHSLSVSRSGCLSCAILPWARLIQRDGRDVRQPVKFYEK